MLRDYSSARYSLGVRIEDQAPPLRLPTGGKDAQVIPQSVAGHSGGRKSLSGKVPAVLAGLVVAVSSRR